jgi:hypothetical protein
MFTSSRDSRSDKSVGQEIDAADDDVGLRHQLVAGWRADYRSIVEQP